MKICPVCNNTFEDDKSFCTMCGSKLADNVAYEAPVAPAPVVTPVAAPAAPVAPPTAPVAPVTPPASKLEPEAIEKAQAVAVYDHTAEFDAEDIKENKLYAILVYLLGIIGIIIAKLCAGDSKFVAFHIREELKLVIVQILCALITAVSFYLVVTSAAFGVISVILFVLRIIAFFKTVSGKAEEVAIIRNFTFLK